MSRSPIPHQLIDERKALSAYFDALLIEAPEEPPPLRILAKNEPLIENPTAVAETLPTLLTPPVIALPDIAPTIITRRTTTPPPSAPKPVISAPKREVVVQSLPTPPPVESRSEIPVWGQSRFQVMLFRVAGLTLAVPLVELSGVQEWSEDRLTPMPGHTEWYLGLVSYRNRRVPVIDTALFVLPENRKAYALESQRQRLKRIVYIDESRWGLACDEVNEVITLNPDQIRWRSNRTSRRWLSGTVIEKMCALIDPPTFAQMLSQGVPAGDRSDEELNEPMSR